MSSQWLRKSLTLQAAPSAGFTAVHWCQETNQSKLGLGDGWLDQGTGGSMEGVGEIRKLVTPWGADGVQARGVVIIRETLFPHPD